MEVGAAHSKARASQTGSPIQKFNLAPAGVKGAESGARFGAHFTQMYKYI